MIHGGSVRPVRVTVDKNGVVLSCIGAEVSSCFQNCATWFGLEGDWLSGIGWQIILTLFTGKDDIIVNSRPVHSESGSLLGTD